MKSKEKMKLVIVGHIDHGKSSLIGRLIYDTKSISSDKIEDMIKASNKSGHEMEFAFLLDHLQEEREQGITIDTTQAVFRTSSREYVVIDAPGHVEFLKNMVTGASQAEVGILIIDGEERIQEQTKRHVFILSMLGFEEIIVLVNKMDLVDYKEETFTAISLEIQSFLKTINLTPKSIIPISAINGDNVVNPSKYMDWYKGLTVLETLDSFECKKLSEEETIMTLPVQDVYKLDNKRVAVGRLETGKMCINDEVTILPTMQKTTVKSIEKFMEQPNVGFAGESIGITTKDPIFLERGSIICAPNNMIEVTNSFKASIFYMSQVPLNVNEKIIVRCATQEVSCEIERIEVKINSSTLEHIENNSKTLRNLEVGEVEIRTKKPISVALFKDLHALGRFVLVKDNNIYASGIVTGNS